MSLISFSPQRLMRKLSRAPLFSLMTIMTLALGIGANTAVFSVIHGVLLKPLPYANAESLVGVWHQATGFNMIEHSPGTYFTYRDQNQSFIDIGLWVEDQVAVTGIERPEQIDSLSLTDGTLPILGITPALGRIFVPEDMVPDGPRTVILSHSYWQDRLGGQASTLGTTLTIDGNPHEVIGMLPAGFELLDQSVDVYLPLRLDRSQAAMNQFNYQAIARLRPGVDLEQANRDVARMIPLAVETYPGGLSLPMLEEMGFGPKVQPLEMEVIGDVGTSLWVLFGTVGIVLLIACANVANLFLIRAESRHQEVAVRTALGASRADVRREFLGESLGLAILGGIAGIILAALGLRLLVHLGPTSLPRLNEIGIDPTVLIFCVGITWITGILLGLLPSMHLGRFSLSMALKEGGRAASDGRQRNQMRHALVVGQTALALVLMVGAGLMFRSFQALQLVEPGFTAPEEVLTFRISIPSAEIESDAEVALAYEGLKDRLGAIPGIEFVAAVSSVPMENWNSNDALYFEDFPVPEDQLPPIRRFKWATPDYFETLGNPLLAGRTFTWADIHERKPVVVITENLAREYWQDPREALGKRVRESVVEDQKPVWREIIGVVADTHDDGVSSVPPKIAYWPYVNSGMWGEELFVWRSMNFVLRGQRVGELGLVQEAQEVVWAFHPNLPLANVRTFDTFVERSMARTSFTLVMLGIAALVALLLGIVGIYGVTSYAVSQRTREIGVRMALGAQGGDVRRMILSRSILLGGLGVILGLGVSYGLTRWMSALLFGVQAMDPLTLGLVAALLLAIAYLASYLPAHRASRTDPIVALRWE